MKTDYYLKINQAQKYICDRCNVAELRDDEYSNNRNTKGIYCDECWNWIHLKKWTDKDGNYHTLRSERRRYL